MKQWVTVVFALGACVSGCLPDCEDNIPRGQIAGCKCTNAQLQNRNHSCCDNPGGACKEDPGPPASACAYKPVDGLPVFAVEELSVFGADQNFGIEACEPFIVHFLYFNAMNQRLGPPATWDLPIPVVNITEVQGATTAREAPAPWSQLESCQAERKDIGVLGIVPETTTLSSVFAVSIDNLPIAVGGVTAVQLVINPPDGNDC